MPKCEHGLTSKECYVCASPKHAEQAEKQVVFKIYKPTLPRGAIPNVRDAELPWVYDQDPSSGNVASMWVTPVKATPQLQQAEKQVFYSGNGTAGRENMTAPTGFFFQMPKAEKQEPVAIYQYQLASGSWIDQTKNSYDYNVRHGQATVRVVYTTPQPQQAEKQEPVPWQGCDLDGMVEAFDRVIEAHFFRKNPFHNPIDADAQMALRILRGFIPYMKQYTTPQPQQDAWKNAAIRLGEELSSFGPDGYYDMTAEQWLSWALDQQPNGKNSLPQPQREWVGLTDEERDDIWNRYCDEMGEASINDAPDIAKAIEQALKEKNA